MATVKERLAFLISADASDAIRAFEKTADSANKEFSKATSSLKKFGDGLERNVRKAMFPAAVALSGIAAGASKAISAAGDYAETVSKIGVVFGDSADEIQRFADGAAQTLGQSRKQAMDAAASFALFGKAAGLSGDELVGFSLELVKLATDLASIQNTSVDEAILAIGSGLRGEAEPLRRFNILLDDFTLRQEAMRLGLIETTKQALTPQQKVLAAQAVILRQGSYALDDFARTSDGLANQQRILQAEVANITQEIGMRLLPAALELVTVFRNMIKFVTDNQGAFFALGATIATVSAAVFAVNAAYKVYNAAALVTKAINSTLNTSFSTLKTSMGLIAGALAAAGFVYAIVKSKKDDYKESTDRLTEALKLEAGAQQEALAELVKTDPKIRDLIEATRLMGATNEDLARALNGTESEFQSFYARLIAVDDATGLTWEETNTLVDTLFALRKEVLANRDAFALAGNTIRASAANFRKFEEASGSAMKSVSNGTDGAARRVGGGVSKISQAIDSLRSKFGSVQEAAKTNLENARKEFTNFAKSVASSITGALSFGEIFSAKENRSFISALRDRAAQVADFTVLINRLIAADASEAVVQQVLGAGVEAGTQIANELLNTAGGVQTANDLLAQTQTLADRVGQNAAGSFRQAGVDTATALVQGIESVVSRYRIRLRSRGLTERQLQRLQRNFETEVNFQFTTAGVDIPQLAEGGIVRKPTLAIIGEAGPEAVVPLNRDAGIGGNTYVTINVSGGDPQAVVNALVRWSRQNGPLPPQIRVG